MTLPGWAREPLVHFLLAGIVLFALLSWRGEPVDPASRVIDIGKAEQAQLALRFERTMGRAPTDAELDAQIERFVRDEVLYREALRLGLDQDDAVVRRRLVSKMDMSASAAAEAAEPDEATLRAFFEANPERYANAYRLSFEQQLYAGEEEAEAALAGKRCEVDCWTGAGQPTSLPRVMKNASAGEIEARFGAAFARSLSEIAADGEWAGPVQSGFGWHIVSVDERNAEQASFEALRERIENDWRSEEIASRKQRAFKVLRDAYRVEIDR
ncbi:MAG: peptidylprolyl isomerase [Pseudomonadota bacterium]